MPDLRVDVGDAIATFTLDRPDALNSLTVPLKEELIKAFRSVAKDPAVRVVILTGAGRAFCAGQDLRERLEPDAAPLATEIRERFNPLIVAMRGLEKPIIGAINGIAAGAGASIAFACDIRIAAEGASFLLAFGKVGLVPDSGATWFLPRLVGPAKATELAMTGNSLSAADAERFGRRGVNAGRDPRIRGLAPGNRRRDRRSRGGARRLRREAPAPVHRQVAAALARRRRPGRRCCRGRTSRPSWATWNARARYGQWSLP
jgi:enoyl-CoA hydratase/carnithine racemase